MILHFAGNLVVVVDKILEVGYNLEVGYTLEAYFLVYPFVEIQFLIFPGQEHPFA
jgi:hypothetical protein